MLPPARTQPPPLSELHGIPCALCPIHSMTGPMMHTPCQVHSRCTPLTRCAGFSSAGSTMKPVVHPTSGPCLAGLAASGCACAPQSVRSRMASGPAKRPKAGAAGSGACPPAGCPCWETPRIEASISANPWRSVGPALIGTRGAAGSPPAKQAPAKRAQRTHHVLQPALLVVLAAQLGVLAVHPDCAGVHREQ